MSKEAVLKKLKSKLDSFSPSMEVSEVGLVYQVSDGIAFVSGLKNCASLEMVEFDNGIQGVALNIEESMIGVIVLGDYAGIKEGHTVKRLNMSLSVPVSMDMVGRVLNPLLRPVDGKGDIDEEQRQFLEKNAPGVMEREPVNVPLQTGIKAIDAMIPIGRGQRELIIGDRQTGKTSIAIDTILNQKGTGVLCIYVAIGQKQSKIARIVAELEKGGAMEYTTIVLAGAGDGSAMSYIAPYSGVSLAEYYMDKGKDVLIVYDDLSKHAVSYREISLLLRRPPGREAYPGDVFYLHSRLLERACRRNAESGGGSITALPIIETQAGDVSAYIPTNVISITDGQIYLSSNLFYKGVRPAIDVGLSVSRVGSSAQIKSIKKTAGKMKLEMAQFRELEAFSQFASDLDESTKKQLERGLRIQELLKQPEYSPVDTAIQVVLIFAANEGFLDDVSLENIRRFETECVEFFKLSKKDLLDRLKLGWDESIEKELRESMQEFKRLYK